MSKVIDASCTSGVVTADNVPVDVADILSEGVGASSGILVQDENRAYYIAKTSEDLVATIEKLVDTIGQIVTALTEATTAFTAIDAKPTGGTGSSSTPVAAANVVNITTAVTQLQALSTELGVFKGVLK